MNITYCDYCLDIVDSSRDERRFKPHEDLGGEIICMDCAWINDKTFIDATDIQAHVDNGTPVYWKSDNYQVIKDKIGQYLVKSKCNNNYADIRAHGDDGFYIIKERV